MLSIKGNYIADEGAACIAKALEDNKVIQELDVSFNEIGPQGFAEVVGMLQSTNVASLQANRNPLGDESLLLLSSHVNGPDSKLKRIELCTCKLSDKGFSQFLAVLQTNKVIS